MAAAGGAQLPRKRLGGGVGGGSSGMLDGGADKVLRLGGRPLAKFDLFSKVERSVEVRTHAGGVVSLLTLALVLLLTLGELRELMRSDFTERIVVDTRLKERLRINLDVTFHALSCSQIEVIAMDTTGEHQINAAATIRKHPLDEAGRRVPTTAAASGAGDADSPPCLDCFGAGDPGLCCNSCSELLEAYSAQGWGHADIMQRAPQCAEDLAAHTPPQEIIALARLQGAGAGGGAGGGHHGCRFEGELEVNKVGGNFHVALGHGRSVQGRLVHEYVPEQVLFFNTSHSIHALWFGSQRLPRGAAAQGDPLEGEGDPLEGVTKSVDPHAAQTGAFQYFIEVVPTDYRGTRYYQYTKTERLVLIGDGDRDDDESDGDGDGDDDGNGDGGGDDDGDEGDDAAVDGDGESESGGDEEEGGLNGGDADEGVVKDIGAASASQKEARPHKHHRGDAHKHPTVISSLPGLFFIYDLSPFAVQRVDSSVGFGQFVLDLLAIVGGAVALSKFVDSVLLKLLCSLGHVKL